MFVVHIFLHFSYHADNMTKTHNLKTGIVQYHFKLIKKIMGSLGKSETIKALLWKYINLNSPKNVLCQALNKQNVPK